MADLGMTYDEVKLAQRIIGIKGTSMRATKNYWERRMAKDQALILSLQDKGHVETQGDGWKMTNQGIQQLKQQMGEFSFR
jgi:hypothetical protein